MKNKINNKIKSREKEVLKLINDTLILIDDI